jgi:hypothetical protein
MSLFQHMSDISHNKVYFTLSCVPSQTYPNNIAITFIMLKRFVSLYKTFFYFTVYVLILFFVVGSNRTGHKNRRRTPSIVAPNIYPFVGD